jgi:hypothetical protein
MTQIYSHTQETQSNQGITFSLTKDALTSPAGRTTHIYSLTHIHTQETQGNQGITFSLTKDAVTAPAGSSKLFRIEPLAIPSPWRTPSTSASQALRTSSSSNSNNNPIDGTGQTDSVGSDLDAYLHYMQASSALYGPQQVTVSVIPAAVCATRTYAVGTSLSTAETFVPASFTIHARDVYGNALALPEAGIAVRVRAPGTILYNNILSRSEVVPIPSGNDVALSGVHTTNSISTEGAGSFRATVAGPLVCDVMLAYTGGLHATYFSALDFTGALYVRDETEMVFGAAAGADDHAWPGNVAQSMDSSSFSVRYVCACVIACVAHIYVYIYIYT